jgi:hypothetical protein
MKHLKSGTEWLLVLSLLGLFTIQLIKYNEETTFYDQWYAHERLSQDDRKKALSALQACLKLESLEGLPPPSAGSKKED